MTHIVTRLRELALCGLMLEAADRIELLEEQLAMALPERQPLGVLREVCGCGSQCQDIGAGRCRYENPTGDEK
jgi:hypothetical protein